MTQDPGPATRDPGPKTQDQRPGTQYPGHRTRDQGPRTQDPRPGTQDPGHRTQDPGPRTQDPGPATRNPGPRTHPLSRKAWSGQPSAANEPSAVIGQSSAARADDPEMHGSGHTRVMKCICCKDAVFDASILHALQFVSCIRSHIGSIGSSIVVFILRCIVCLLAFFDDADQPLPFCFVR